MKSFSNLFKITMIVIQSLLFVCTATAGGEPEVSAAEKYRLEQLATDHSGCEPSSKLTKDWYEGYVPREDGSRGRVVYKLVKGQMRFEDDIVLSPDSISKSAFDKSNPKAFELRWPGGRIPYEIGNNFSMEEVKDILKAIKIWNDSAHGTISLVPRQFEVNYLHFQNDPESGSNCWANLRTSGTSVINLSGCAVASIVHEIGHIIGLRHEHSRKDRDDFIKVIWCGIPDEVKYNYLIADVGNTTGPYDPDSIMHYSFGFVSRTQKQIGLRPTAPYPSSGDIAGVVNYYDKNNRSKTSQHTYGRIDYMNYAHTSCKPLTDSRIDGWSATTAQRLSTRKNPGNILFQPIDYCDSSSKLIEYDCDEWGYLRKREVLCASKTHSCVSGTCKLK